MKAEEFYKQRSNSIRELWALSPKQIEYIALIMEEYAALLQPPVSNSVCDCCVPRPEDPFEYDNPICEKCGLPIKQTSG